MHIHASSATQWRLSLKKYTKTLIEEYQLVLVHGLLHLVGYSHDDPKKLSSIENTILKKVWNE